MKSILFIHGWSEDSHCFENIKSHIILDRYENYQINFADFITLDDTITFQDLVSAMHRAWIKHGLPLDGKQVDVITHSTGALVLRAWLQRFFPHGGSPIFRVIMLAPPNFGSHLAHKGTAFYGRFYKGLNKSHPFEVGENLLEDLELGSEFIRNLAEFDCFSLNTSFHANDILLTILIGGNGYDGFAAIANIPCSDGVVPLPAAQLEPTKLIISYSNDKPKLEVVNSTSKVAYKIIPKLNHSTILTGEGLRSFHKIISDALTVEPSDFLNYRAKLDRENAAFARLPEVAAYQQTLINVKNQFNQSVDEYFIAFAGEYGRFRSNLNHFHDDFVKSVHCNGVNPGVRYFTCDTAILNGYNLKIDISITAMPCLDQKFITAGYWAHDVTNNKALITTKSNLKELFKPFSMLIVEWNIEREYKENLFNIHTNIST
jgi:hypothetical protein